MSLDGTRLENMYQNLDNYYEKVKEEINEK
jgi:hypothetical protein